MIAVERHDRSKEEEREVEVVFQEVRESVVAVLPVAVLQSETHTAHDAEATASVEQDVLKVERPRHQVLLQRGQSSRYGTHYFYVVVHFSVFTERANEGCEESTSSPARSYRAPA